MPQLRDIQMDRRSKLFIYGTFFASAIMLTIGIRGCNSSLNAKTSNQPSYTTHSLPISYSGHLEYTKYEDGSSDVKIDPQWNILFDSYLYQDLDGDGKVDRIRTNGAGWKLNSLRELLVRDQDYNSNIDRFEEADKKLKELSDRFDTK